MSDYIEFGQIIDTMKAKNYQYYNDSEKTRERLRQRKEGKKFSLEEHIEAMVFAELSNQRPWKQIAENEEKIRQIFHDFNVDYLKNVEPDILISQITNIRCGNRQISKQIISLKENIETLERIEKEYGSIDNYYNSKDIYDLVNELSNGNYKLKQMGQALVSEYLKGMGVDVIKPDIHVCRILGRLGYTEHNPSTIKEAYEVCSKIAKEYNMSNIEVDSILWQFGAERYFEQCGTNPKCDSCLVYNCKYRNSEILVII